MKVVILAGGKGTRLAEETSVRPKPMVEVGGYPLLWHIMQGYARHGLREFVLALGYKGEVIKDYFLRYHSTQSDMTVDLGNGHVEYQRHPRADWRVCLVDTGRDTGTGGRLRRLEPVLRSRGTFLLTYGDGLSSLDVQALLAFHRSHGRLATVTAVRPPARFGTMGFDGARVTRFAEKVQTDEGWINGGFFVFEPDVLDYLSDDPAILLEEALLPRLAADGELFAYRYDGFWQCMDTVRDRNYLEELWSTGAAPWKLWETEPTPLAGNPQLRSA